jgi:hypothetical protein
MRKTDSSGFSAFGMKMSKKCVLSSPRLLLVLLVLLVCPQGTSQETLD